jgi:hypothetical protein
MESTIRLEAKTGWGAVETVELVSITRPVVATTADDFGLSLGEAKSLLARLQQAMVRGQVAEYLYCRRVCPDCLTFRPRQRGPIENSVTALVELPAAVPASEPPITLSCQVRSLGHRHRATTYAIHRNRAPVRRQY